MIQECAVVMGPGYLAQPGFGITARLHIRLAGIGKVSVSALLGFTWVSKSRGKAVSFAKHRPNKALHWADSRVRVSESLCDIQRIQRSQQRLGKAECLQRAAGTDQRLDRGFRIA
eukprot:6118416-Amphidinium_carterae.1